MRQIIILTLLTDLGGCIAMLIFFTIIDSWGMGLYAGIMLFGNIFLPTLIAVILYLLMKTKTTYLNNLLPILFQAILLSGLFMTGLFIWATADVMLFDTMTFQNILDDYNTQFAGFLPVVLTEALLIPAIDLYLAKNQNRNMNTSA